MSEIVFGGESLALRSLAASGAADDEEDFAAFEDEAVEAVGNVLEDLIRTPLSIHGSQFALAVVVDGDGFGGGVEGLEPLGDRLLVVVDAAGCLAAVEKAPRHFRVGKVEVQNHLRRADRLFELNPLVHLSRVSVD